jgi:hydroxypyruvate reductase
VLERLRAAAVGAADPARSVPEVLPPPPDGRVVVVGAGKASAAMAAALEAAWPGVPLRGAVVVPEGTPAPPCRRIEILRASHPVPDERGVAAARRMRDLVEGLDTRDLVVALVSGGGSALLCDPAAGVTLAEKQEITRGLLASGATIREINAVRQALSRVKGGRLALAAAPASVLTLLVSDIPGDDAALVASGPTLPAPFEPGEAEAVIERYGLALPAGAAARLRDNPPPTAEAIASRCRHIVVGSSMQGLTAAADSARGAGYAPLILGDGLEGDARAMGTMHAGIARSIRRWGHPLAPPAVLLSGGEATVGLAEESPGRGGRNTEFLLALAIDLAGAPGIHALAADTDGIDGHGGHAGAWISPETLERGRAAGLDPHAALARHDSAGFFAAAGTLLMTGPSGTNINDFRAVLVD